MCTDRHTERTSGQQSVRYLGLIISEGTRAICLERIKPILNHLLPMTLRQLRGFWGVTVYCCIWIPGYGEHARPLYRLIAETEQAQTDKLVWSPETERLLRFFRLLSCNLQLWACPHGQNLICLSLKEKVWPWEFWHKPPRASSATYCLSKQRIRCNFMWVAPLP